MGLALQLSALALKQVVDSACAAVGIKEGGEAVVGFLTERFTDHSLRLGEALEKANANAWKALEIALAGESFWQRCQALLGRRENHAFGRQVRAFLDAAPRVGFTAHPPAFRQRCLQEIRRARQAGLLKSEKFDANHLAHEAGGFMRFAEPQALLEAEWQAVGAMAEGLRKAGYDHLGRFLAIRPPGGLPLLVIAVRYFFRRQVEDDAKLSQGLAYVRMERLAQTQEEGFAALAAALAQQGQRLEEMLADVQAVVVETHGAVLTLQEQIEGQSDQIRALGQAVLKLLEQHQLQRRELRPSDSLSVRNDAERQAVRQLAARFRALPEEEQRQLPALLNGLGKLQVVAGDFEAAQRDFQKAAATTTDAGMQAEAHYHAYQAALQRRDWAGALKEFLAAVRIGAERLAPFPVAKYKPQRILGAGGFGVAFLCQHTYMNAPVVIKALIGSDLDQGVDRVFAEAMALRQMDHPAVIRIQDCGYADATQKERPYLVMDYFEGATLEDEAGREALSQEACCVVARQIAAGLQAAHARGILHRDVKPANVLVRRPRIHLPPGEIGRGEGAGWQAKLIDFGLALDRSLLGGTTKVSSKTLLGSAIAGTVHYAAPEQMGLAPGVTVGPRADVYGFAKTCCYALFQTPAPTLRHWRSIAPALADLLGQCLETAPAQRPADFGVVLAKLAAIQSEEPPVAILIPSDDGVARASAARREAEDERRRKEEQERRLRETEARMEADSRRRQEEQQLREAASRAETERRRLEEQEKRLREATERAETERRRLEEQQRRSEAEEVVPLLEVLPVPQRQLPPVPAYNPPPPATGPAGNFTVICPNCRRQVSLPTTLAGMRTPCPFCNYSFTVPSPKGKPGTKLGGCGCLLVVGIGIFIWLLASGQLPEVSKAFQKWFGNNGMLVLQDGNGPHYYVPLGAGVTVVGNTLHHSGPKYGAVEIANSDGKVQNVGQDLNIKAEVLVPTNTEAGLMFRSHSSPSIDDISYLEAYYVTLNSTGEVLVKHYNAGEIIVARSGPPASFDSTSFHTLEVRAHDNALQAALDNKLLTFEQDRQFTTTVAWSPAGRSDGMAGLIFDATTGQQARNLVVTAYSPFPNLPVQNNFAGKKDK